MATYLKVRVWNEALIKITNFDSIELQAKPLGLVLRQGEKTTLLWPCDNNERELRSAFSKIERVLSNDESTVIDLTPFR